MKYSRSGVENNSVNSIFVSSLCSTVYRLSAPAWPQGWCLSVNNTVAEKYKPPTLADFSPMFHFSLLRWTFLSYASQFLFFARISLLHWRISLLRCTFVSYARGFLSYTADFFPTLADFSPTLAKFLFSTRIYLAEQKRNVTV